MSGPSGITGATGTTGTAGTARAWRGWQLHVASLDPAALESVVVGALPPVLRLVGRLPGVPPVPRPWYFVRAWAPAPHLRVCVAGLDDRQAADVEAVLRERTDAVNRRLPATGRLTPGVRREPVVRHPVALAGREGPRPAGRPAPGARGRARDAAPATAADREQGLLHASSAVCLRACSSRTGQRNAFTDGLELLAAALAFRPDPQALLLAHRAAGRARPAYRASRVPAVPVPDPEAAAEADRFRGAGPGLRALAAGAPSRWSALVRRLEVEAAAERGAAGEERARRLLLAHLYAAHNRLGLTASQQARLAPVLLRLGVAEPGRAVPRGAHALRG